MNHILAKLPKQLVAEMQKLVDLGYDTETIVKHLHKEIGVQPGLLRERLATLTPTPGSKGEEIAKAAKAAADKKDK
jgi:hypothetical protein